eukprot:2362468-Alexandrium_andersonii.AAC.1
MARQPRVRRPFPRRPRLPRPRRRRGRVNHGSMFHRVCCAPTRHWPPHWRSCRRKRCIQCRA